MGKYKGYEKYKDSGVEWVVEIPEHWKICKLKRTVTIFGRIGFRGYTTQDIVLEGEGAITLSPSNILDGKINYTNRTYLSWDKYHESPEIQVFDKDILFVKTGSTIGKVAIAENMPEPMTINPQLVVLKEINCCPEFLAYLMNADFYQFQVMGFRFGGSTPAMTQESLGQTKVILLPLDEQEAIAQFLDYKTKQIDDLITKKETLIEKLDEKRTALISHAVTKGLDPSVPMKDSGIEWLGEIPEHWSINKLGRLTEEINDINHEMPVAVDQGIPFLSAKDLLDDGTLNFEKDIKKISEEDFIRLSKKICPKRNDIIYSRIGACLGKARIVEVDIQFLVSYSCCVIRLRQELADPRFFKYFLDSELILSEARLRTQGIGVPDLGLKQISKFTISVPPILEQIEIAEYLNRKTAQIKQQKSKVEKAIELLKEYRTSLITNAVTGKIDVRQVSIP
ncbi:restriction endonuclease subunit S [Coleofasciculus sp. FACHB-SPT36]|uniref:restriction endonuclease subunit S n=1 Tax=Cyanophyceae TaxID=3028117 RepID=UPI00168AAC62|nr:restriction endonuclease subunit S [Coleofasciculus sp. FACHB-SPT36]MBD2538660.1 restriction endonuclease subunit S [Coleofasciculus sp. FACHB-SPT36]